MAVNVMETAARSAAAVRIQRRYRHVIRTRKAQEMHRRQVKAVRLFQALWRGKMRVFVEWRNEVTNGLMKHLRRRPALDEGCRYVRTVTVMPQRPPLLFAKVIRSLARKRIKRVMKQWWRRVGEQTYRPQAVEARRQRGLGYQEMAHSNTV